MVPYERETITPIVPDEYRPDSTVRPQSQSSVAIQMESPAPPPNYSSETPAPEVIEEEEEEEEEEAGLADQAIAPLEKKSEKDVFAFMHDANPNDYVST